MIEYLSLRAVVRHFPPFTKPAKKGLLSLFLRLKTNAFGSAICRFSNVQGFVVNPPKILLVSDWTIVRVFAIQLHLEWKLYALKPSLVPRYTSLHLNTSENRHSWINSDCRSFVSTILESNLRQMKLPFSSSRQVSPSRHLFLSHEFVIRVVLAHLILKEIIK